MFCFERQRCLEKEQPDYAFMPLFLRCWTAVGYFSNREQYELVAGVALEFGGVIMSARAVRTGSYVHSVRSCQKKLVAVAVIDRTKSTVSKRVCMNKYSKYIDSR